MWKLYYLTFISYGESNLIFAARPSRRYVEKEAEREITQDKGVL